MRAWRDLPNTLQVMLLGFAALPALSLGFAPPPWQAFASGVTADALLLTFAFWLGPALVVAALLARHVLLVAAYLAESAALAWLALRGYADLQPAVRALGVALAGALALTGALLLTKDFLLPLLDERRRSWRRYRRLMGNRSLVLLAEDGRRVPLMLEDASAGGLRLYGSKADLAGEDSVGRRVKLLVRRQGVEHEIPAEIVWQLDLDPYRRIGVRALEANATAPVLEAMFWHRAQMPRTEAFVKKWAASQDRRTLLALWSVSMAGVVGVPACGQLHDDAPRPVTARVGVEAPASEAAGFGLAQGDSAQLSVAGCERGSPATVQVSASGGSVSLLEGDRGCRASLVEVARADGVAFLPPSGVTFATAVGATTRFLGSNGEQMDVTVLSQLSDALAAGESVVFRQQASEVAAPQTVVGGVALDLSCAINVTAAGHVGTLDTVLDVTLTTDYLPQVQGITLYPCGLANAGAAGCGPLAQGSGFADSNPFSHLYSAAGPYHVDAVVDTPSGAKSCALDGLLIPTDADPDSCAVRVVSAGKVKKTATVFAVDVSLADPAGGKSMTFAPCGGPGVSWCPVQSQSSVAATQQFSQVYRNSGSYDAVATIKRQGKSDLTCRYAGFKAPR